MISAHNSDILPQKDRDSAQSKARSGQTREGFIQRWRLIALMKPPALNYRQALSMDRMHWNRLVVHLESHRDGPSIQSHSQSVPKNQELPP